MTTTPTTTTISTTTKDGIPRIVTKTAPPPACRIILLLDLDCFYAQCERVRLGLASETCSLALLQWNSVLAVTYPARKFGIKRGDSWEQVMQKSNQDCLAIHLPLLETKVSISSASAANTSQQEQEQHFTQHASSNSTNNNTNNNANHTSDANDSLQTAYERTYHLTHDQRQQSLAQDVGRQRFPSEGKACLERYRLASARIFHVVLTTLQNRLGGSNNNNNNNGAFILERASIDELFLDVTEYCWRSNNDSTTCSSTTTTTGEQNESEKQHPSLSCSDAAAIQEVMQQTVLVGKNECHPNDINDDSLLQHALQRGCWVSKQVRQAVWDELGFTLSAGISTSKLVAKLGATFGKPNGQAVIYPNAIPYVMDQTPIRKVRHLGGKLGKQVVTALEQVMAQPQQEDETPIFTMGHVAQHLSVPQLAASGLGPAMAQKVFDAARGMDTELVKETVGALVQSITAFKSFGGTTIDSPQVLQWLHLLARDVLARVQQDVQRNKRYPKSCTVQYTYSIKSTASAEAAPSGAMLSVDQQRRNRRNNRTSKSVRIAFPKQENHQEASSLSLQTLLVHRAKAALLQREGISVLLHRIGLAAMDFEQRGCIASYFGTSSSSSGNKEQEGGNDEKKSKSEHVSTTTFTPPTFTSPVASSLDDTAKKKSSCSMFKDDIPSEAAAKIAKSDEEMAHKLQALEQGKSSSGSGTLKQSPAPKTTTIKEVNKDLRLARKLQATYDRENSVLTALDKRKPAKRVKIDSFFRSL